ncbi:putative cytochrome c subunit [Aspergillus sclerotioniger CBS 115572]|uniref:Cytochrome c oxidase subunit 8, mitochondrial n=1 Tax=Aspergillus sclerotioniger CBS 115572 TaxID=1450535 RepID=A0A317XB14_9EURO|nr:putative cytochrome c subunit [Aspergillus sclerotioniger CBS 115572]PWY93700.1 putative cytochrome c subunit [Aspergillus sclerotioniger CBS 115572]
MYAATALRARMATSFVARRGFSTTRAQLGSPYHYAEGPRSNIPFNPLTKYFFWRYWAFMVTGFGAPFAIAGTLPFILRKPTFAYLTYLFLQSGRPTRPAKRSSVLYLHTQWLGWALGNGRERILRRKCSEIVYKAREFIVL